MSKIYIDEAGRWPLAGPLYVGLVLPVKRFVKKDFKDSKSISEKIREELFQKIDKLVQKGSVMTSIWVVTAQEIDELKLTKAINLAIRRGLLQLFQEVFLWKIPIWTMKCSCDVMDRLILENFLQNPSNAERPVLVKKMQNFIGPIQLIIDGKYDFWLSADLGIQTKTIIKGDQKNSYIAMASILAKVSRDHYVCEIMHPQFPEYWFDKHKGYWTARHRKEIERLWICTYHRKLFF